MQSDRLVLLRNVEELRAIHHRNQLEGVSVAGEKDVHAANHVANDGFVEGFDVDRAFLAGPERREDIGLVHVADPLINALLIEHVLVCERENCEHLRATLDGRTEDTLRERGQSRFWGLGSSEWFALRCIRLLSLAGSLADVDGIPRSESALRNGEALH